MNKMVTMMAAAAAMGIGDYLPRDLDTIGPQCGIKTNTNLKRMRRKERARELTRKREAEKGESK